MPSDKDRLYIALYARGGTPKMSGGEDKYHWSFIIGPKNELKSTTGRRCHTKETVRNVAGTIQTVWEFEDRQISLLPTSAILVRIMIAKVADEARLREAFAKVPIRAGCDGYEGWNCVSWLQEALSWASQDNKALGSGHTNWPHVKDIVMWYVAKKVAEHRFDGQGQFDNGKVPTWDAIEGKELFL